MGASGSATPARVCSVLTAPSGTFAASHRHHAGPVQPFGHRLMFPAAAVDGPRLELRLLRSAGGSQPVFGHGACAVVYEAEHAECDADHPDAEHSGGGSPCRVPNVSPRNTMQLHEVIASYGGDHSAFNASRYRPQAAGLSRNASLRPPRCCRGAFPTGRKSPALILAVHAWQLASTHGERCTPFSSRVVVWVRRGLR